MDFEYCVFIVQLHLFILLFAVALSLIALLLLLQPVVLIIQPTLDDGSTFKQAIAQCLEAFVSGFFGLIVRQPGLRIHEQSGEFA